MSTIAAKPLTQYPWFIRLFFWKQKRTVRSRGSALWRRAKGWALARPFVRCRHRSAACQRTVAVLERTERFIRRDSGAQFVEVAGIFGFCRRLHLEQISRMQLAAVGADGALAEQRIVGRQFLHLRHHRLAVGRALQRGDRLEVVRDAGIDAGLYHGRELARRGTFRLPALGPGPVGVVHVPVPGFRQSEALRGLQTAQGLTLT